MTVLWFLCLSAAGAWASNSPPPILDITLTIPEIDAKPYHRPYVAVWIEDPSRTVVRNLALWYEEDTWLKDLRQWWRVFGRKHGHDAEQKDVDGWSGATRRPGVQRLKWDGLDNEGQPLPPGPYVLCFESSREEGGRSYLRQAITLGDDGAVSPEHLDLDAKAELGPFLLQTSIATESQAHGE